MAQLINTVCFCGVLVILMFGQTDNFEECGPREHRCLSGGCLPVGGICDGRVDCPMSIPGFRDDEDDLFCRNRNCATGEYSCGHGHCIPESWVCDGRVHCKSLDISDEGEICVECPNSNASILSKFEICDGTPNCPHGEDESRNICSSNFRCNSDLTSDAYVAVLNISTTFDGDLRLCIVWCWQTEFCVFVKSSDLACILLSTRAYYNTSYSFFEQIDLGNEGSVLRIALFCDLGCVGGDCFHLEDQLINGECRQGTVANRMNLDQVNPVQIPRLLAENSVVIGIQTVQKGSNYTRFRFTLEEGLMESEYHIQYDNVSSTADSRPDVYLCRDQIADIHVANQQNLVFEAAFECGDGDIVNALVRCDGKSDCLNHADEISCPQNDHGRLPCRDGDSVPYSMYCDFIQDCKDGSDEDCVFPECNEDELRCDNEQCVHYTALCNGHEECFDGSDESQQFCESVPPWWQPESRRSTLGSVRCRNTTDATCDFEMCRCGQLKCPHGHCINNIKLCDGEADCPSGVDERSCKRNDISGDTGHFRCQRNNESLCLSNSHLCDGKIECTLADDERLCTENSCPALCFCNLYEVRCHNLNGTNTTSEILKNLPLTRYLDISGSSGERKLSLHTLDFNFLYFFNLSHFNINKLTNVTLTKMPNLIELDLSQNNISEFKSVLGLSKMKKLDLSQNVIKHINIDEFYKYSELQILILSKNGIRYIHRKMVGGFKMLHTLDITYNAISTLSELRKVQLHTMENLRNLLLNNNNINDTDGQAFDGIGNISLIDLSHNNISRIEADAFTGIRTVNVLDLTFNRITRIQNGTFRGIETIQDIDLSRNEISEVEMEAFTGIEHFKGKLILHSNRIERIFTDMFGLLDLTHLSLSRNGIANVQDRSFQRLSKLKILDISGNNIRTFSKNMFVGLMSLEMLKTDNYKFCCLKPRTLTFDDCFPKADEFSSCENLMRNVFASHMMCILAVFAVGGNLATFMYRTILDRQKTKKSFGLFVTNLAVSDFLMGIYLTIIAAVDLHYQGSYIWNAQAWKESALCYFAGVISTLSSEASVFFLCLITLDRVFVTKWPLGKIRFTTKSAILASTFSWLLAIFIAILPVLYTDYFGDEFYSVNGVCIALPLTRARPKGWEYSLAVFIFFNCLTFLLVAVGQIMIFVEVQSREKFDNIVSMRRKSELRVARNLLLVVLTDFMCWVPVGIMGIMALAGHTISGDVYVWASVFILPVNAALNPCLYTLSAIIKKDVIHALYLTICIFKVFYIHLSKETKSSIDVKTRRHNRLKFHRNNNVVSIER